MEWRDDEFFIRSEREQTTVKAKFLLQGDANLVLYACNIIEYVHFKSLLRARRCASRDSPLLCFLFLRSLSVKWRGNSNTALISASDEHFSCRKYFSQRAKERKTSCVTRFNALLNGCSHTHARLMPMYALAQRRRVVKSVCP
jgi:hypothetical protein